MQAKIIKNWTIIFIIFIWFVFSFPFFVKNLAPFPSQYQANFFDPWSSYGIYEGPVKNNAMPDVITQIYPWRQFTIDSLKDGVIPLWNPYSFAGTPHLANYQSAVFSPMNLLFFLPLRFVDSWSLLILFQPLLGGLGMYFLIKSFRLNNLSAASSAVAFMFCGFMTTWMAYGTLGYAILFLPWAFYFVNRFIETRKSFFGVLLSFSVVFSLFSGHFQTSIYFLIAVFTYILYRGISLHNLRMTLILLIYLLVGFLISMPQILPSIEFYLNSVRQSIVTQLEVIPLGYLPTLIAPDIFGNPVTRNDWFGHYAEWNGFSGTLTIFFAILAAILLFKKDRRVIYFIGLGLGALLVAFDTPINLLVFKLNLPLFSTSASSRIIVLFSFAICVLAAFGINHLLDNFKSFTKKMYIFLVIGVGFVTALLWSIPLFSILEDMEKSHIAKSNLIFPTLIFFALIFSLFMLFLFKKRKIMIALFSIAILILISIDMLRFVTKWMPFEPKELVFKDVGVSSFYKDYKGENRFLGNFSAEESVYYRIQTLGGYDPLYPKRYGEFVKYVDHGRKEDGDRSVVNFPLRSVRTKDTIDFLGVEYIPQKKSDDSQVWAFDFNSYPIDYFSIAYEDEAYRVFKNNNSYPRSYIVNKYKVERDDLKILQNIFDNDIDLREEAVLEKDPNIKTYEDSDSAVKIISYNSSQVDIEVQAQNQGILILSDNYYPGWKAYINDNQTEIFRANYTFRSIVVPEGKSVVKFIYAPDSFRYGLYLFLFGLALMVAITIYEKKYGFKN